MEILNIGNKEIYIVENHHEVLVPWALYRRRVDKAPILITLDHHIDTEDAFYKASHNPQTHQHEEYRIHHYLKDVDFNNTSSIERAISKLYNDEHIDAAIKSDIIDKTFVISYDGGKYEWTKSIEEENGRDSRPYHYPEKDIYIVENRCFIGCENGRHDDSCIIGHFNQAIESSLLNNMISIIGEMKPSLVSGFLLQEKYILDIDLDYFHTRESIKPSDSSTFYSLIKNAEIITIATEPEFIKEWATDYKYDTQLNADLLLSTLKEHILKALSD